MAKYLLIASRDPFESNEAPRFDNAAAGPAKEGRTVWPSTGSREAT